MKHLLNISLILFSAIVFNQARAQEYVKTIDWYQISQTPLIDTFCFAGFEGANYFAATGTLPVYFERLEWQPEWNNPVVQLSGLIFEELTGNNLEECPDAIHINDQITIRTTVSYEKKQPFLTYSLIPIRKNGLLGIWEKLVSFKVTVLPSPGPARPASDRSRSYSSNSLLAEGNWYKIAVGQTGVHQITYNQLVEMGVDVNGIDPRTIRLFGYGGEMLPENSAGFRYDDLVETPVYVSGEEDGKMDPQDYILFYGEGPVTWKYDYFQSVFKHTNHLYADEICYFLTPDLGAGKRINEKESLSLPATDVVTTFNDYLSHELDEVNLIKSGRYWLGEIFEVKTEYDYTFEFPNIINDVEAKVRTSLVARSTINSSFRIQIGDLTENVTISAISSGYNSQYAREVVNSIELLPSSPTLGMVIKYNKTTSTSVGWLNYIEVNVRRKLIFTGDQMAFRDATSSGPGKIAEFNLSNGSSVIRIWEVTDPLNISSVQAQLSGSSLKFKVATDTLREFIAFNGNAFFLPRFVEKVENQNLHSLEQFEYIIVAPQQFLEEANRLAQFHRENNGLVAAVIPLGQIYNEFSSGSQDITAIRDFVKMLYDRASPGSEPRYLLLFGDGSYDNKNRLNGNTNLIPTYQSAESYHPVTSYVTDDYYGILDDGEGTGEEDMLDIGVGRMPVQTIDEVRVAVDKIVHYSTPTPDVMGDWRNVVAFVADDEDSNIHLTQAENLANYIDSTYSVYNVNKIYLDSYTQVSTPGGQRYPEVNSSINDQVEKGALILNYTGHGGEVGWAHERVLELTDINGWNNRNSLPVFVTATCEFSRFDDPARTSAGEYVFLNPNGGGLALFTTTRATFGSPNYNLNKSFYTYAFRKVNGKFPTMGDIILYSKRQSGSDDNGRKFILLGDPAQQIAYPSYRVETTSINFSPVSSQPDTIGALSEVTITGEIMDFNGQRMNDFNGTIYTTFFDKPQVITTQGNDGGSTREFDVLKSILYKGKTSVSDGTFELTFIVPKDISYRFGKGKISYYTENGSVDAHGYYNNVVIGGYGNDVQDDETGPDIRLYMNNEYFRDGGLTNEDPVLIAHISDESGINTVGNGIGHDIVAVLDDNTDDLKVLNDYYQADLNTYKSGVVNYPYFDLDEGPHQINIKVWDAFNNSQEALINFVVVSTGKIILEDLTNYPNPFTDKTYFSFESNQGGQNMEVEIMIFSVDGQLARVISREVFFDGFRPEPIEWDGRDYAGNPLSRGVYVYRITLSASNGSTIAKSDKLVIMR